jgi:hypothetical protein
MNLLSASRVEFVNNLAAPKSFFYLIMMMTIYVIKCVTKVPLIKYIKVRAFRSAI